MLGRFIPFVLTILFPRSSNTFSLASLLGSKPVTSMILLSVGRIRASLKQNFSPWSLDLSPLIPGEIFPAREKRAEASTLQWASFTFGRKIDLLAISQKILDRA